MILWKMDHWYLQALLLPAWFMAEDAVPETPADKLESEFSCSNFAKEFFQRNQENYEIKSLALFQKCMRELLVKFKYYIGSI